MAGEAGAERRGDVIGQPGDDGNARAQAGTHGDCGRHAADDVRRVADRAEEAVVDAGCSAQIGRVRSGSQVVETALERPVALAEAHLGQPSREPVVRPRDPPRTSPERGSRAAAASAAWARRIAA